MTEDLITSSANPLVKQLRRLRQRKYRAADGLFLVEGIQQVWRAVENDAPIQTLIVAPELLASEAARAMVEERRAAGLRVAYVTRAIFEETTEREHPAGLAAVVGIKERSLADLTVGETSFFVALEEVGNPGNLGSIIRSVDATQGSGVILVGPATDPWHPVAVKASVGTLFTVPVCRASGIDELATWCKGNSVALVATSAHADIVFWEHDYKLPSVFLFGSEARGLDPETLRRCAASLRIPMAGSATSLNLAVSVGVLLYELRRHHPLTR
ncbi:MAG TPA: RNA methyltransferase [Actinomycetota bacterium]|nr:RNA methyltransferase [Actinomycetota bacterium]